jgi:SEC-C motif
MSRLADVLRRRDPEGGLSKHLVQMALWKLSCSDEIPASAIDLFRGFFDGKDWDFTDPETYFTFATMWEIGNRETSLPPEVSERLLPYQLLTELQRQTPTVVDRDLVRDILANSGRCAPLWRAALREWARDQDSVSAKTLGLITALLGELAGPDVLDDLLDLSTYNDQPLFLHTHWAIWRIGQRYPCEALAVFRAAIPGASVGIRCGLANHLSLLPDDAGIEPALAELLEGFRSHAREEDAAYLLLAVVDALARRNLDLQGQALLAQYEPMLSRRQQKWLREILTSEEGFVQTLVREELDQLDINDICVGRALMDDEEEEEDGEDGEASEEEGEEDEADFEEPPEPRVAPMKPGRNEPCWCGSGKKYKKCHLAADEDAERPLALAEAGETEPVPGDPAHKRLFAEVTETLKRLHRRADFVEANRLYFDRHPSDIDARTADADGFFQWYVYDFRPAATGRTAVEEYLRKHGPRLSAPELAMLESWRDARFGLFEVQSVEEGRGVELKDVCAGDRFFVHDVSSSRELVRWDCVLSRVEEFDGKRLFAGNGMIVPRQFLPDFLVLIETESRAAQQTSAEFVRANSHRLHRVIHEMHEERLANLRVVNAEGDSIEFCSAAYEVRDAAAALAAAAPEARPAPSGKPRGEVFAARGRFVRIPEGGQTARGRQRSEGPGQYSAARGGAGAAVEVQGRTLRQVAGRIATGAAREDAP